jgi:hypothetical protein
VPPKRGACFILAQNIKKRVLLLYIHKRISAIQGKYVCKWVNSMQKGRLFVCLLCYLTGFFKIPSKTAVTIDPAKIAARYNNQPPSTRGATNRPP